jgi:hypothetical protein
MQFDGPFYVTGGTLSSDALCYVTRRADEQLYDGLHKGNFCYVLTARQMGKSSLMVHPTLDLWPIRLTAEHWLWEVETTQRGFWI